MAIDLRQLRYVVVVAEERQMTRAARRLHVAQPALSQAIGQLELSLGIQLFHRTAGGVEPTRAGRALLPRARQALSAAAAAEEVARAAARSAAARLTISFVPPLPGVASLALADTARAHPDIRLTIEQADITSVTRVVREERSDFAFVWSAQEEPGLVVIPLLDEPRVAFLGLSHPLAGRRQLTVEEIVDEPLPGHSATLPGGLADYWELADRRKQPARHVEQRPRTVDELAGVLALGEAICLGCTSLGAAVLRPGIVGVPLVDVEPARLAVVHRRLDERPAVRGLVAAASRHSKATSV